MSKLRTDVIIVLGIAGLADAALAIAIIAAGWAGSILVGGCLLSLTISGLLIWESIDRTHPYVRLGFANQVTLIRVAIACLLFGFAADIAITDRALPDKIAWIISGLAFVGIILDGLDGWLARRERMTSNFGARLDMEADAFLILILSVLALLLEKAGAWVILLGAMRYIFWLAGMKWRRLTAPLPVSWRRKAVCVLTGLVLVAVMVPLTMPPLSTWLVFAGLLILIYSFVIDGVWLLRPHPRAGQGAVNTRDCTERND